MVVKVELVPLPEVEVVEPVPWPLPDVDDVVRVLGPLPFEEVVVTPFDLVVVVVPAVVDVTV